MLFNLLKACRSATPKLVVNCSLRVNQSICVGLHDCTNIQTFDRLKHVPRKSQRLSSENPRVPRNEDVDVLLPDKPEECCGDECECCVWLLYVNEIKLIYRGNAEKVQEALNSIPDPDIQNYVKERLMEESAA